MSDKAASLRLLTREDCHLCEVAERDLIALGIPFATVDVDRDETLRSRYGDSVPGLLHGDIEVARAPFSTATLQQALANARLLANSRR